MGYKDCEGRPGTLRPWHPGTLRRSPGERAARAAFGEAEGVEMIKMKMMIATIGILLFCCAVTGTEIAEEHISHGTIPDGGHMEFNTIPRWDGNQTLRLIHSFPEINMHMEIEVKLIPGHVYSVRVEDMGPATG